MMSDRLNEYLLELQVERDARREPLDDHLVRLYMRDFNTHIYKGRKTKKK